MDVTMERGRWAWLWRAANNWPGDKDYRGQRRQVAILDKIEAVGGGNPLEPVTVPLKQAEREMLATWLANPPVITWSAKEVRIVWGIREALGYPLPKGDEDEEDAG